MAYFSGLTGSLQLNTGTIATPVYSTVAKVRSWSLSVSQNMAEAISLGESAVSNFPTYKTTTGSAEIFYSDDTAPNATSLIGKLIKRGATSASDIVRLRLNLDGVSSTKRYITLDAYITSAQIGQAVGEVTRASINFTMDGDFVDVTNL